MKPVNLDRSRLLGFKIIGKGDASLNEAKVGGKPDMQGVDGGRCAAAIGAKIGPKPTIDVGTAALDAKIGLKPSIDLSSAALDAKVGAKPGSPVL